MRLSALLSQTLVAFTIEFDNEFEHQMPHRIKSGPMHGGGPWLVSQAMWANFMHFVPPDGAPLRALATQVRLTNLAGLQRWGYVTVTPDPGHRGPLPPRADWVVRATIQGRRAQDVWRPLGAVIERRWAERFGAPAVERLQDALDAVTGPEDAALPAYLPVLGYGLRTVLPRPAAARRTAPALDAVAADDLSASLSRVLLRFALDAERESNLGLAIGANIMRVLDDSGVRVRDLPRLTGVSKESHAMATAFLGKYGLVEVGSDPDADGTRRIRLTSPGASMRERFEASLTATEDRWQVRVGADRLDALRASLEPLVVGGHGRRSPLWQGLEPYPDGWRARVRPPETLPHYPMVLHRGGYPDGS